jgi:cell wall-associated NlpC family hydrolase
MSAIATWRRLAVAIPILLVTALAFTLFVAAPADAAKTMRERKIHHGLEVALNQKGDPYSYGSDGPNSFDCSGLTMFSYHKAGLYLPRSAADQSRFARRIPKSKLRRGDFVFFENGGSVYHVALFLGHFHGKRYVLHAPHSGTVVQRDPLWTTAWFAGTIRHRG